MSEYMTTNEVAELLRTSPESVRFWRHVGRGPASFKVGRRVLYAREDVERFIAEPESLPRRKPPDVTTPITGALPPDKDRRPGMGARAATTSGGTDRAMIPREGIEGGDPR